MANSVTLGMAAVQMKPSLARAISKPIMQASEVLPMLSYEGTSGNLFLSRLQDSSVPTPNWRHLNDDAPNPSRGTQRRETRWVGIMDFVIKLDTRIRDIPAQWESHVSAQIRLHGIGAGFEAQRVFFEGSRLTAPAEPDGLKALIDNGIADGSIPSAQKIDAGTGGATLTFALLDQQAAVCYGSNRSWMAHPYFERKILALARDAATSGILRYSESRTMLGRPFLEYNGMKIFKIERMDDHSSDLGFDENDGSGNLDTSRIYLINISKEDQGVYAFGPDQIGIQVGGFKDLPGTPFVVSYSSWSIGFMWNGPTGGAVLIHLNQA